MITDRANYGMVVVQLSDLVPDQLTTGGGTPTWHLAMAATLVVMLPPIAIVMTPAALGSPLPVVAKELVRDLMPDLGVLNGYTVDKIEGFAIDAAGTGFAVTDNDGVDDSSGETLFWSIGAVGQ